MKNDKIKTSFVSPEGPKARANKTGIDLMIYSNPPESGLKPYWNNTSIIVENLKYFLMEYHYRPIVFELF